jgi:hypothetical protein
MNHPQQYPHSAVYPSGKQTNTRDESCAHTMMNNFPSVVHYVLSHFKTLEAQTQALQLNSVYSREKVNIFRELKTCTVWKFCRTMTDLSVASTCTGEPGLVSQNSQVLIRAVL